MGKGVSEQGGYVWIKQIGKKAQQKNVVYVDFMDLDKTYDRVIGKHYGRS